MKPTPRLPIFLSLALTSASASALAAPAPTDAQVCQRMKTVLMAATRKIQSCTDYPEGTRKEGEDCITRIASCKMTTKRWYMRWLDALERNIEPIPQCRGPLEAYMRDPWGPAIQAAFDEIGTIPIDDENCGFLTGQAKLFLRRAELGKVEIDAEDWQPEIELGDAGGFFLDRDAGPSRRFHVSALGFAGGYAGATFGVGGLVGVPLRSSLVPALNDALYFEGGGRALFVSYSRFGLSDTTATFLQLTGGARWDVHFSRELSAYWAVRLGALVAFELGAGGFRWGSALGGHWRWTEGMGLRVEVDGSNFGTVLSAGVSFFL